MCDDRGGGISGEELGHCRNAVIFGDGGNVLCWVDAQDTATAPLEPREQNADIAAYVDDKVPAVEAETFENVCRELIEVLSACPCQRRLIGVVVTEQNLRINDVVELDETTVQAGRHAERIIYLRSAEMFKAQERVRRRRKT